MSRKPTTVEGLPVLQDRRNPPRQSCSPNLALCALFALSLRALCGYRLSFLGPAASTRSCVLPPPRKRPPCRSPKSQNQFPHQCPPLNQLLDQRLQFIPLAAVPIRRNLPRRRPDRIFLHPLNPRQPRLKRLPSRHRLIHFIPRIHPAQRIIRK